jgi:aerobic carbon-monoxide dehydrogenase medium subunit
MKAPPFEYHRATSLDEALALLSTNDNAKALAGGQSLVPMLNLRYVFPDHLVDLNPIADLAGIKVEKEIVRLGAMTRQHAMAISPELQRAAPIFAEALAQVGHRQTRNRGTFGGSLCHLDPAAELPTVALLYDATVHIASPRGRRALPMREFIAGYMSPAIEADELVAEIELSSWPPHSGYAFLEHARRHGDFAIASAACLIEPDGDRRRVRRVAIAVGGLTDRPVRLERAEQVLSDAPASKEAFCAAAKACDDFEPFSDVHASADYRAATARTVVSRALAAAWSRASLLSQAVQ